MSIASEITRLQGVKSDILTAIGNKGVTVPAGSALDDCPGLIASIPTGPVGTERIGNNDYHVVTLSDGHIWMAEELRENFGTYLDKDGTRYYYKQNQAAMQEYLNSYGFRLPTRVEVDDILRVAGQSGDQADNNKCKSLVSTRSDWNYLGNNSTGFNLRSIRCLNSDSTYLHMDYIYNDQYAILFSSDDHNTGPKLNSDGTGFKIADDAWALRYYAIRAIKIT